jgi:beta-lactamase regulating signal transducer with metallopeptidase domain
MTAWRDMLESMPVAIVAQVTLILLAAVAAQSLIARSAAARHAILFWGLAISSLCPLLSAVARQWPAAPATTSSATAPANSPPSIDRLASQLEHAAMGTPPGSRRLYVALLLAWRMGTCVALARLGHGLYVARRIRRAARPLVRDALEPLQRRLEVLLGRTPPAILVSDEIQVPMAVGGVRPVVLLPSSLAGRLNERQLLQVLVHESAHALRRDPLVGLWQRLFAAAFWFHPLVHLTNRLLDRAREELCDNFVLRAEPPAEYSRTLAIIAESISFVPSGLPAQALFRSAHRLDDRIAGLLNPRRCKMTRLRTWRIAAVAASFVAGGSVLACLAAPDASRDAGYDVSHIVNFEVGRTEFRDGDKITVEEVHGTSDKISAGNLYIVKGSYRLASEKSAMLAAFVTGDSRDPKAMELQSVPTQRTQTMTIDQGSGRFTLIVYLWYEGNPHISFYPAAGGNSFGGVYFGTGASTFN